MMRSIVKKGLLVASIIILSACGQNTDSAASSNSLDSTEVNVVKTVKVGTANINFPEDWYYEEFPQSKSSNQSIIVFFENEKPDTYYDMCYIVDMSDVVENQVLNAQAKKSLSIYAETFYGAKPYEDLETENMKKDGHPALHFKYYVPSDKTSYDGYVFMSDPEDVLVMLNYHHDNSEKDYSKEFTQLVTYVTTEDPKLVDIIRTEKVRKRTSDYAPGSDWENYDYDKDGHISDDEWQDALGDYLDKYTSNINSSNGCNSSGCTYGSNSSWKNYDSDSDGRINDDEWQDALGDWLDSHQ